MIQSNMKSLFQRFEKGGMSPKDAETIKKKYSMIATDIRETMETVGWKKWIEPILKQQGNPAKVFHVLKKTEAEPSYRQRVQIAKIEAYHNFLNALYQLDGFEYEPDEQDEGQEDEVSGVLDDEILPRKNG